MAKQFERPPEIKVKTNISGVPISLIRQSRSDRVIAVYERWRVADEWWCKEVEREYFRVRTNTGFVCDIFRDTTSGRWHLSKIYD